MYENKETYVIRLLETNTAGEIYKINYTLATTHLTDIRERSALVNVNEAKVKHQKFYGSRISWMR